MDKLGVGVVGPGWAGGEHIRAYMNNPNVEIVALCGRDEGRTRAKIQECGVKTHEICLAGETSAREGRSVKLPLLD